MPSHDYVVVHAATLAYFASICFTNLLVQICDCEFGTTSSLRIVIYRRLILPQISALIKVTSTSLKPVKCIQGPIVYVSYNSWGITQFAEVAKHSHPQAHKQCSVYTSTKPLYIMHKLCSLFSEFYALQATILAIIGINNCQSTLQNKDAKHWALIESRDT